jgi:hypothetical protein
MRSAIHVQTKYDVCTPNCDVVAGPDLIRGDTAVWGIILPLLLDLPFGHCGIHTPTTAQVPPPYCRGRSPLNAARRARLDGLVARVTLETLLRHEGSSPLAVATVSPSSKSCERSSPSLVLVESPQGDAYTRAWSAGDRPGAMSSKSEGFESMYARTASTSSVESTDRSTPPKRTDYG